MCLLELFLDCTWQQNRSRASIVSIEGKQKREVGIMAKYTVSNIHQAMIDNGIETNCSSESTKMPDLYVPVTATSRSIVENYDSKQSVTTFKCAITGARMYDIPFAFDKNLPATAKR